MPDRTVSRWDLVARAATIIALPLSLFLFWASRSTPDIRFAVAPGRTVLVDSSRPLPLRVEFEGEELRSPVSVARVIIWNAGRQPVVPADLLEPLSVRLSSGARILHVEVAHQSRAVIGAVAAPDSGDLAGVLVSARVLEQGDFAVIHLVYEGGPETPITVSGQVIGQGEPRRFEPGKPPTASPSFFFAFSALVTLGAFAWFAFRGNIHARVAELHAPHSPAARFWRRNLSAISSAFVIAAAVYWMLAVAYWLLVSRGPPTSF